MAEQSLQAHIKLLMEQFSQLNELQDSFAHLNGEHAPPSPPGRKSGLVTTRLMRAIVAYDIEGQLGEVFVTPPFVFADIPGWGNGSRIPDLFYVCAERMAQFQASIPEWDDKPYLFIPDLVVEVVSPADGFSDVYEKTRLYLEDGVRVVWLVDRKTKTVTERRAGSNRQTILTAEDMLDGGDIIPGFAMPVAALFE